MPRYRITDSTTGRTLLVEGDSEPTEQDAEDLFSQGPAPAPTTAKAPVKAAQETVDRYANNLVKATSYLMPGIPSWASRPLLERMGAKESYEGMLTKGGAAGDVAAQIIPAVGGSIAGAFTGNPLGVVGLGAAGAGAGNALKQAREILRGEKESIAPGELIANTAMGGVPIFKLKAGATALNALGRRAFQGGALAAGGSGIEDLIDHGEINWGKLAQNGAIGTGLGMVLGVPEAIALRKVFGGKVALEGQTLKKGIEQIATERGISPDEVAAVINANTIAGKSAKDSAEVFQKQVPAKSAQDSADAILAAQAVRDAREQQFNLARTEEALQQMKQAAVSQPEYRGPGVPINNAPKPTPNMPGMSTQAQRMYDEYGGINPALLLPMAKAAVGGGVGALTGDTPEERVRNALIGAGITTVGPAGISKLVNMVRSTKVAPAVAEAAQNAKATLYRKLSPQSLLPDDIRRELRLGQQASNAIAFEGSSLAKDIDRAVSSVGHIGQQGIAARSVQEYLTGKMPLAQLPAPVREQAERMRIFIDSLSDRAITEGVVSGELATTFASNKGSYLRRSYEAFLKDGFKPDKAKVNAAVQAIVRNGSSPDEANAIVGQLLNKVNRSQAESFLAGRGKIGSKDVSSLVKREDLLPEVRDMLGEIKDPIVNATETVSRLGRLIEMDAAQQRAAQLGQKLGVFSTKQTPVFTTPLASDANGPMGGLAGLYATPDVAAGFQRATSSGQADGIQGALWKTLRTGSSVAKASKTVWNPVSWAPNLIGGIVTNVANGNFRVSATGRGLLLGAEELGMLRAAFPKAPSRDSLVRELAQLRKLGVVGESVGGKDLQQALEKSFWRGISNTATKTVEVPAQLYGGIDDLTRYAAFKSEEARVAKMFPGMPSEQAQLMAADRTRATMPTYSEIPQFVRDLSTAGLTPQFIAFRYELFRNTFNTAKIAVQDIQQGMASGNRAQVLDGSRRMAGLIAVMGAAGGTIWSASKLSKDSHKVTDAQENAMRYYSAPWDRDAVMLHMSGAGDGKPYSFSNLSYLIPQAMFFEPIEAAQQGKSLEEAMPLFLKQMAGEWYGNPAKDSIVLSSAIGAFTGTDPNTGRGIPNTDIEPTVSDKVGYFAEKAFKPLVLDFIEQTHKAAKGEKGDYGKTYTLAEQRNRLMGFRQTTVDPKEAVKWKTRELGNNVRAAAEIYRLRQGQNLTPDQNEEHYQAAESARRRVFQELQVAREHAAQLGVTKAEFVEAMRDAGISPVLVHGSLTGIYTPMTRDKNQPAAAIAEALHGKPDEERRRELAKIHLEQGPFAARNVVGAMRANMRDEAMGITPEDEALRAMSTEERADYISRLIERTETTEERAALVRQLRVKRILTPQVEWALRNGK